MYRNGLIDEQQKDSFDGSLSELQMYLEDYLGKFGLTGVELVSTNFLLMNSEDPIIWCTDICAGIVLMDTI